MLVKNYHYDYYCIEALTGHQTMTYDGRIIVNLKPGDTYPISNGKEIVEALLDMSACILTSLKNQGLEIKQSSKPEVIETIRRYLVQTLPNLRLQLVVEDGYKRTFVQHPQGTCYFDLKEIGKYDPYQSKYHHVKVYMLGGIDLLEIAPDLWHLNWICV
ncbi:MAG: hypothetical protein ACRCW2_05545 [Cellulosilyticaceae bacterium]